MSIESEINRINTNVQNTLAAIEEMGGEVPEDGNSDDMAGGVKTIPIGAKIDDTTPSASTTYSSEKIEAELSKQKEAIDKKVDTDELNTAVEDALTAAKESGEFDGAPGAPGEPGKDYVLTEADKEEIAEMAAEKVDVPEGGSYTLPIATPTTLGGVKPTAKTHEMTQEVGVDADGKLWGMPGGGSDGLAWSDEKVAEGVFEAATPAGAIKTGIKWSQLKGRNIIRFYFKGGFGGAINIQITDAANPGQYSTPCIYQGTPGSSSNQVFDLIKVTGNVYRGVYYIADSALSTMLVTSIVTNNAGESRAYADTKVRANYFDFSSLTDNAEVCIYLQKELTADVTWRILRG